MVVERTSRVSSFFKNSAKRISFLLLVFLALIAKNSFADTSLPYKDNVDGSRTLTGHVPAEVAVSTVQYHANANEMLDLQLILPITNQAQLDSLLKGIYDPQSLIYHHFLTSDQFNQQFKVSGTDLNTVKNYFSSQGFAINKQSPNGSVLSVTGSAAAVERAFRLHINHYIKNDGTMFRAPDTDPTIPTEIVGKVSAVGGLDDLPDKFKPHVHQVPQKLTNAQAVSPKMTGTGPGGFLAPGDVKTAYNLNAIPSYSNSLQNVALFELDGYLQSDIAQYESHFNLPNNNSVILQNVLIDGYNGLPTYTGGNDEVTLDIEELMGIAPWAYNKIYVYETANTWQGWIDEWTKIANDNAAKVISCSWGIAEYESPVIIFDTTVFSQMAAQGQEVFVASGDCGAYDDCYTNTLTTDEPASQPYATGVGISALSINSNGTYKSETASLYGGGGVSQYNSIPSYQQAMAALAAKNTVSHVSTTMRNVPDVALTADPSTAYAFYITVAPQSGSTPPSAGWYGFWGSSIAAPTWAAFLAQVNQGRVHAGQGILGFLNPVIYQMAANGSQYATDFHDITTGNNQYYPAQAGLDDATGLGSFNGFNLYSDLVPNSLTIPPAPVGLQALGGISQVSLSWSASNGATSYDVKRSTVSGGGSGYTTIASLVFNTDYTDSSAVNGTTYYYVVSAVNSAGQSSNSLQVSAEPVLPVPSAPVLSAAAGNAEVLLNWTASSVPASYNVERAMGSAGPYATIASGVTTTTYTDVSVSNGTTYYYVISAVNASGSANSAYASATPSATVAAVTDLTGTLSTYLGHTSIILNWTQSGSLNIVSNNVYYSINSASYVKLATLPATTTVTTIGEGPGETYNFYVTAVNSSGAESAMSNQVHVATNGPPGSPTIGTATAGNAQATVNFTAPLSNGGYAITSYTVTVSPGGKTVNGTSSPIIVTGLTNGAAYTFSVTATNSAGTSSFSFSSNSVIPAGPPVAPTTVTAAAGNADAVVSFSGALANGSAITGYTVTASPGGKTVNGTSSPITITGLTNGTAYTFTVTATNSIGTSTASAASKSVTPAGVPVAPTTVTAAAGNADAVVSFSGALANGSAITGYTVTASPGGKTVNGTSSPITITGLTNGTAYTFTVKATNAVGASTASAASKSVTPAGVPAAPTTLTAVGGNADAIVSFSGALANGSAITGYTVTASPGGKTVNGTSSPITVTGLTNGTAYTFTVKATNAVGTSTVSAASNSVTPVGIPAAPTNLTGAMAVTSIVLKWTQSSSPNIKSNNVYYSKVSGGSFVKVSISASTTFSITGSAFGATYYYYVTAVNSSGLESPASNEGSIVTSRFF